MHQPTMNLKLLKRERLYDGKVFNLIVDQVEYPSGNRTVREVAEHPGGAVVLASFSDQKIILVKQHRYPIDKILYELPAGKLKVGEDPQVCAARELIEETGYVASKFQKLTAIYTTPGFCSECLHIFLATDLQPVPDGQNLEEGEQSLTVGILPMKTAIEMIERGEIVDGKTICGILLGERILKKLSSA